MTEATLDDLQALERLIEALSPEDRQRLSDMPAVKARTGRWQPNPGPQTEAYYSKADVLLYGGEPGGGKSQLILGLAFNEHQETFIMRRKYGDLERLISDALTINGGRDGFSGSPPPRLFTRDGRKIYFRAAQHVGDEQGTMGQGRDLLGIDEATQFAESQVRFLMGWVRTSDKNQRTRTVLATNPPLQAEGLWVIKMFAPWLDPRYPNPAKPGELRWVHSDDDGNDLWVDGPHVTRVDAEGKIVHPTSRTYIPSSVDDNPYYRDSNYKRQLDALPEPYRSLLMGGFRTSFRDQERQVIPTAWIKAAMARWKEDGWKDYDMTAMALDPAGGGRDSGILCWRHSGWYAPFVVVKAGIAKDGDTAQEGAERAMQRAAEMASQIVIHRRASAPVIIDMGGGYGGDVTARLKENGIDYQAFDGSRTSTFIGAEGIRFTNARAEAWWRFREELNPEREGGSVVALPDDPELLADLTAPTFEITRQGIKIEAKEDIKDRLGRSPDRGDAAVMCLSPGNRAVRRQANTRKGPPKVILAYPSSKHHYNKGR